MEGTHPSNKSYHSHGNKPLGELLQLKQALFHAVSYLLSHQFYQWDVMSRLRLRQPSHLISNMSVHVREKDKSTGFKSATCSVWGNKQSAFSLPYNKPWGCERMGGGQNSTLSFTARTLISAAANKNHVICRNVSCTFQLLTFPTVNAVFLFFFPSQKAS